MYWESEKDDNTDEDDTDDEWTEDDAVDYHTEIFAKGLREQRKVLTHKAVARSFAMFGLKNNLSIDETIVYYRTYPPNSNQNPDGYDHTPLIEIAYKEIESEIENSKK